MGMEKRAIGNSGLKVSPLAFGGNVFGWTVDEALAFRLLDAFTAAGFNLIDTADSYSKWVPGNRGGESETTIYVNSIIPIRFFHEFCIFLTEYHNF